MSVVKNFNITVTQEQRVYNVIVEQNYKNYVVHVENDVNVITVQNVTESSGTSIVGPPGPPGAPGEPGREIEIQKNSTHIQWRYVNDTTWIDIVAISELKGDDGIDGLDAYEIAVANGFPGTESEWLDSLKADNDLEDARARDENIYGPINANNNTIENLANAVSPQQPVTKSQLDALELTLRAYSEALSVSNFRLMGDWDFTVGSYPTTGGSGTSGALRRGDAFRHSGGTITFHGTTVQAGDIFYVISAPPGQVDSNWSSLDYNQQQAIETAAGVAKICTAAEAANENSTNNTDIVTPKKLWANFWSRVLALSWVWALRQTFTTAPRLISTTASTMVRVNSTKDVVSATPNVHYLPVDSPVMTGSPEAPTQSAIDYSNKIATTKWIKDNLWYTWYMNNVTSVNLLNTDQTVFLAVPINPNEFRVGTQIEVCWDIDKQGSSTFLMEVGIGTNPLVSPTGLKRIGIFTIGNTNRFGAFERVSMKVDNSTGSTTIWIPWSGSTAAMTNRTVQNSIANVPIDLTVQNYFIFAYTNGSATSDAFSKRVEIKIKY